MRQPEQPDRAQIDRQLGDLAREHEAAWARIGDALAQIAGMQKRADKLLDDRNTVTRLAASR